MAPANDLFAAAAVITGRLGTAPFSTVGATEDPGDSWGGNSVWFKWTAPASYLVSFIVKDFGEAAQPYVVVYEDIGGTIDSLAFLQYARDERNELEVTEGTTYYIAIQQNSWEDGGAGTLRWGELVGHWSDWIVPPPYLRPYHTWSSFTWRTLRQEINNTDFFDGTDYQSLWEEAINRVMADTGFEGNDYGDPGGQHVSTAFYHDRVTGGGTYFSAKASVTPYLQAVSEPFGDWGWFAKFDIEDTSMVFDFFSALMYRDSSPAALDALDGDEFGWEPVSGDYVQYESEDPNEVLPGGRLQCAGSDIYEDYGGRMEVRYVDPPDSVADWSPTQPAGLLGALVATLTWDAARNWTAPGVGDAYTYGMGEGMIDLPGLSDHVVDGRLGLFFYCPRTSEAPDLAGGTASLPRASAIVEAAIWVQLPRYRYWALEWVEPEQGCPPRLAATCRTITERVRAR